MTAVMKASREKRVPVPMNGVDTPALLATINAVGAQPELAKFRFRANSRWIVGTQCQTIMHGFFGAGGEHTHLMPYKATGDHPAVLCGADAGPRRSNGFCMRWPHASPPASARKSVV